MLGADGISDGLDNSISFELCVASDCRADSILHNTSSQQGTSSVPQPLLVAYRVGRFARTVRDPRLEGKPTFFGGPPEWKCGFRISFAKASRSTLKVFLIEVTGVMRLIHRLFFNPEWACASVHS